MILSWNSISFSVHRCFVDVLDRWACVIFENLHLLLIFTSLLNFILHLKTCEMLNVLSEGLIDNEV